MLPMSVAVVLTATIMPERKAARAVSRIVRGWLCPVAQPANRASAPQTLEASMRRARVA